MLLKHGRLALDTRDMITYETGLRGMPYIFQSHDGSHVVISVFDVTVGIKLHYASPSEVEFYARKFALPALLNAYPPEKEPPT